MRVVSKISGHYIFANYKRVHVSQVQTHIILIIKNIIVDSPSIREI